MYSLEINLDWVYHVRLLCDPDVDILIRDTIWVWKNQIQTFKHLIFEMFESSNFHVFDL